MANVEAFAPRRERLHGVSPHLCKARALSPDLADRQIGLDPAGIDSLPIHAIDL
jgi:hypothetical protein